MKLSDLGCFALIMFGIVMILLALGAAAGVAKLGFDLVAGL
jgi:hypothetical protein